MWQIRIHLRVFPRTPALASPVAPLGVTPGVQDGSSQLSRGASIPASKGQGQTLPREAWHLETRFDHFYSGRSCATSWSTESCQADVPAGAQYHGKARGLVVAKILDPWDLGHVCEWAMWTKRGPKTLLQGHSQVRRLWPTHLSVGSAKTSADVSRCVLRTSDKSGGEIHSSVFGFQPYLCFTVVVGEKRSF